MNLNNRIKKLEDKLSIRTAPIDLDRYAAQIIANLTLGLMRFGVSEDQARELAQQQAEYAVECTKKYGPGWKIMHGNGSPLFNLSKAGSA